MANSKSFKRGDIIKVFNGLVWHYGVVVGKDEVVHFNLTDEYEILIIKSSLERFVNGGSGLKLCKMSEINKKYSDETVAKRAESKINSDFGGYNLLTNNCEHFANWCAGGKAYSNQNFLIDEGEGHSVEEKLFESLVGEPVLETLEAANDFMDDLNEKTDEFFSGLMDLFS